MVCLPFADPVCPFPQLWKLYIATPLGTSKQIRDQGELQQSYMKVRRDLNATSSQDEFAKWAKLRRQHDKMLEELEKMSACPFPKPAGLPRSRQAHTIQGLHLPWGQTDKQHGSLDFRGDGRS